MATKLQAADIATRSGIEVVIASGKTPALIGRLVNGERIGTRFIAQSNPLESRKERILAGPPPHGELQVDDGAARAVRQKGLQPAAQGDCGGARQFERGDAVRLAASMVRGVNWPVASAAIIQPI